MCISPIKIGNPNYGRDPTKGYAYLKDCTSHYIYVPCQKCAECIAMQQMELVQRIQMEALKNWLFMGTLTYKNECMPRITTSLGYEYRYAEIQDFSDMIKRLRRYNTFEFPFRTIYVSERGTKGGRPHFHCLLLFDKDQIGHKPEDAASFAEKHKWDLFNEWRKITKAGRYSQFINLCDYRESIRNGIVHRTYDFHFVDPRITEGGITDCAFYVLKYMLKGSEWEQKVKGALFTNYDKIEAEAYWKVIQSKQKHSLGFGLNGGADWDIIEYLRQGVERSKKNELFAQYYCPEVILSFPLAHYYKQNGLIYDVFDAQAFYFNADKPGISIDSFYSFNKEWTQSIKKMHDYERKLKLLKEDTFSEIEELYNI